MEKKVDLRSEREWCAAVLRANLKTAFKGSYVVRDPVGGGGQRPTVAVWGSQHRERRGQ